MFISGRIEFLGKHTDYCGGRSLVCAIAKGFFVDCEPNDKNFVRLINQDTKEVIKISIAGHQISDETYWSKYPQTVIKRIAKNFKSRKLSGANINFRSNLPQAAGLSSSSALMIAVFSAISKVNNLPDFEEYQQNIADKIELAEYLGCIENGQNYKNLTGEKGVGTFG
ncbi:MAG TPA: galactokinase family protein, partial [Pyrinomonadaceae bacterium]|nr:galactokinase family protein [Pyrinomonadaceae bacterium]